MNKIKMNPIKTCILISIILVPFFVNCGYHLSGAGSTLPEGVKSIAIPDFENRSSSPDAQQYITFAIRDEFITRSKLKLINNISEADLVLEGKITKFKVKPLSYTNKVSANLYSLTLILDVKLIDTINNKIIYNNSSLKFSDTYDIDSSDFFSQEGATMDKIAKDIASTIVTGILENF